MSTTRSWSTCLPWSPTSTSGRRWHSASPSPSTSSVGRQGLPRLPRPRPNSTRKESLREDAGAAPDGRHSPELDVLGAAPPSSPHSSKTVTYYHFSSDEGLCEDAGAAPDGRHSADVVVLGAAPPSSACSSKTVTYYHLVYWCHWWCNRCWCYVGRYSSVFRNATFVMCFPLPPYVSSRLPTNDYDYYGDGGGGSISACIVTHACEYKHAYARGCRLLTHDAGTGAYIPYIAYIVGQRTEHRHVFMTSRVIRSRFQRGRRHVQDGAPGIVLG